MCNSLGIAHCSFGILWFMVPNARSNLDVGLPMNRFANYELRFTICEPRQVGRVAPRAPANTVQGLNARVRNSLQLPMNREGSARFQSLAGVGILPKRNPANSRRPANRMCFGTDWTGTVGYVAGHEH